MLWADSEVKGLCSIFRHELGEECFYIVKLQQYFCRFLFINFDYTRCVLFLVFLH